MLQWLVCSWGTLLKCVQLAGHFGYFLCINVLILATLCFKVILLFLHVFLSCRLRKYL